MTDLETTLRQSVDAAETWRHVEKLSTIERLAGTPAEREAVDYIMGKLAEYGVPSRLFEFESFVSYPIEAELEILSPVHLRIPCRPRAFAASTPAEGIVAEVVYVPSQADHSERKTMIFAQAGRSEDYAAHDVLGKIVLTTGGGPDGLKQAQDHGAVAHCHMWPSGEDVIHEMIVSSIWGTPTPESAERLVKIPSISIKKADGERLKQLCAQGPVRARVTSNVYIGWKTVLLPLAQIEAAGDDSAFMLVGGHHCSWYVGTTDNATGDACLLEMARLLYQQRANLRRSVRIAWWPSHSQGRYAGSTWYADHAFAELRRDGIAYLGIDSPGVKGAEVWDCRYNHAEVERFMDGLMREVTGQEPNIRRPLKAGDQSFWGIGMPSLGAYRMVAADSPVRANVGGSGGGYWWHSPEDTIDKGDPAVLASDTQLYLSIISRLCAAEKLPFEFVTAAKDFTRLLKELQEAAQGHADLSPALAAAKQFEIAAGAVAGAAKNASGAQVETLNRGLMQLSRIINPVLYTATNDFDQDPALQLPMLPALQGARQMPALPQHSNDHGFLRTRLVREHNRVVMALEEATEVANELASACA
jgi:hypothetical protein